MNKSKKHVEGDKKNIESGLIISKPAKNTAYFVPAISPDEKGPGILVLHSWWGLNSSIKKYCEKLSDLGYCVMAPDLFGTLANNEKHAQLLLNQADPNEMADLILSSIHALRTYSRDSTKPICIIGFAMGGSLGLWASTKLPDSVSCVYREQVSYLNLFQELPTVFGMKTITPLTYWLKNFVKLRYLTF